MAENTEITKEELRAIVAEKKIFKREDSLLQLSTAQLVAIIDFTSKKEEELAKKTVELRKKNQEVIQIKRDLKTAASILSSIVK